MIELIKNFKLNKKGKVVLILFLCLVALVIYFIPENNGNKTKEENISNNIEAIETKEKQLEKVLSNIKGAGKVSVMITYKNGNEVVCATNIETQTNTVTEKSENGGIKESETVIENKSPVTIDSKNGENALVIVENEPEIKGVIVVAQGAEKVKVKMDLQKAVETVLQVSPSQVEIFAMN